MSNNTTILISKGVRDKIKEFGKKGDTYTDILEKMCKNLKLQENTDMLMETKGYLTISQARKWTKDRNKLEGN